MLTRRNLLASSTAAAGLWALDGLPAAALLRGALAQGAAQRTAASPAARQNALFEALFAEMLRRSPETVTRLGLDRADARVQPVSPLPADAPEPDWSRAKYELDDRSTAAIERRAAVARSFARELRQIDRSRLTGMDAVNHDTIAYSLAVSLRGLERFEYGARTRPQAYVVSQISAAYVSIPDFLDTQHRIEDASDADAYLSRLQAFATVLDQETERALADAALGAAPPDFVIDKTILQLQALRNLPPAGNVLAASLTRRATQAGIGADYGARAERLVAQQVYPALERQIAALEKLRPGAAHEAGVWRLPDGEAYYRWGIESFTTTRMSGDEIHLLGVEQVADIESRLDTLLRAQGLKEGTVGQRLSALSRDPRFLYPNTDEGRAKLLADLNSQIVAVSRELPEYFGTVPRAPVEVRRVPPVIEAGAPGGYYQMPTLDGSRPGAYYINLRDTGEWPSWTLPTLTYHEANPGHHWQIALALEAEGIPMVRKITGFSAHSEGWALYAEQLADEIGMYERDPWGRIGFLQSLLFRAVRLVVDSGLHQKRWSREQAIRYMTEHLGEPESSHVTEVERYAVWPGQASSYKVGHTVWLRLREAAKAKLGRRFDLRGFHDVGLLCGAMPLEVLEGVVAEWVASQVRAA